MIIVTMLVLICVLGRLPIYLLIIRTHSLYYSCSFYFRNILLIIFIRIDLILKIFLLQKVIILNVATIIIIAFWDAKKKKFKNTFYTFYILSVKKIYIEFVSILKYI